MRLSALNAFRLTRRVSCDVRHTRHEAETNRNVALPMGPYQLLYRCVCSAVSITRQMCCGQTLDSDAYTPAQIAFPALDGPASLLRKRWHRGKYV